MPALAAVWPSATKPPLRARFERPPFKGQVETIGEDDGVLDFDARANIRQIAHDTIDH
jgi:hypothetical protein